MTGRREEETNKELGLLKLEEGKGEKSEEELRKETEKHEAKTKAIVLEMLEDIPDADIKPPENVLFVCKLNSVTQEEDLELIFSRFGPIKSCQIIRDWKSGDSLQYAFIEYEYEKDCIEAYMKMQNCLIDERRIHVDFSQSVAKLWSGYRRKQLADQAKKLLDKEVTASTTSHVLPSQYEVKSQQRPDDPRYRILLDEQEHTRQHTHHREHGHHHSHHGTHNPLRSKGQRRSSRSNSNSKSKSRSRSKN